MIIQNDQVDFIQEMQWWLNKWKPVNVTYHINKLEEKEHNIISLDTEKVFENFQYSFMIKVLEGLGIQGT